MDEEAQKWQRRYQREHQARQEAERLLEGKSLDLYRRTCQLDELVAKQEILIEERTRDFEKANEQVVMLSDAISHTLNGVIITGKDDTVIWANTAVERLTGYTLDEMLGNSPGQVLQGPETEESVRAYMREHIDQRLPFDAEVLNYSKTGRPYWIHLQATPVMDANGDFKYYVAIQSDITEEKKNKTLLAQEIELSYAAAGHPPALLISRDGDCRQLESSAPPLGLFPQINCSSETICLERGDRFIAVTDGLYEWKNGDKIFGWDAMVEWFTLRAELPAKDCWRELQEKITSVRLADQTTQEDDETILILSRK